MPLFPMYCRSCTYKWEQLRRVVESPATRCPNCEGNNVHQIIEAPRFTEMSPKSVVVRDPPTKVYQTDKRKKRAR